MASGYTYNASSSNATLLTSAVNITTDCLFAAFSQIGCFVSTPEFKYRHDGNKITVLITAFYYAKPRSTSINHDLLTKLHTTLSKVFTALDMDIEVSLIKVHTPMYNASILCQWLVHLISPAKLGGRLSPFFKDLLIDMFHTYTASTHLSYNEDNLSASIEGTSLKGIKIRISGKLTSMGNRPRYTVREYIYGNMSTSSSHLQGKGNSLQVSQHTSKNVHGTFTVKVWVNYD